jgi:hypothetical protein
MLVPNKNENVYRCIVGNHYVTQIIIYLNIKKNVKIPGQYHIRNGKCSYVALVAIIYQTYPPVCRGNRTLHKSAVHMFAWFVCLYYPFKFVSIK